MIKMAMFMLHYAHSIHIQTQVSQMYDFLEEIIVIAQAGDVYMAAHVVVYMAIYEKPNLNI